MSNDRMHNHHCMWCHQTVTDCDDPECLGLFNMMCESCFSGKQSGFTKDDCRGCEEIRRQSAILREVREQQ